MSRRDTTGLETLVIGIDAAGWPVIDQLLEADVIPTLETVFEEGVSSALESQIPPWTSSAWPSIYTGMNPGKHGVFDFITFEGYDWQVTNATHVRERPIWEYLSKQGHSSVVVNVPVTYPPTRFDGALVPGYMAPEHPECHPSGLLEDLRDELGSYRVYPTQTDLSNVPQREAIEEYQALTRMRGRAFRYLADRFDPDFGFLQFQQSDSVFHERPDDRAAIEAVYGTIDEEIGEVLEACTPETVFVISDHGIGPYDGYEFRINEYLRKEGYVKSVRGGPGMPSWSTVRDRHLARGDATMEPQSSPVERTMAMLARVGVTSQRLSSVAETLGVREAVLGLAPTGAVRAATEQVDFEASRAYMRSRIELGVRINLAGREPNGTVPEEEYETVRDELISLLRGVRTPDGNPVFETVDRREAFYDGPAATEAVDIVTVPAEFDQFLSTRLDQDLFGPPSESWNHKRDGIIAVAGGGVDGDKPMATPQIFDLAPSVLATFGIPQDTRMDGSILPILTGVGEREYPGFEPREPIETGDETLEHRLTHLGYLDQ